MSETQTLTKKDVAAVAASLPVDSPNDQPVEKKKRKRQRRYQLFDDGQGDYRIYELATADSKMPAGALVPIPGIPGFPNAIEAKKAIRNSGEKLANKQVMIIRGLEIMRITVETRPTVAIEAKPRRQVSGEPLEAANDAKA